MLDQRLFQGGDLRPPKEVRLSGLEPETYGLKVRSDEVATTETVITSDFVAERLGVLLGALGPSFDGLAAVVKAWPALPEPMRRAILAMVEASQQGGGRS